MRWKMAKDAVSLSATCPVCETPEWMTPVMCCPICDLTIAVATGYAVALAKGGNTMLCPNCLNAFRIDQDFTTVLGVAGNA